MLNMAFHYKKHPFKKDFKCETDIINFGWKNSLTLEKAIERSIDLKIISTEKLVYYNFNRDNLLTLKNVKELPSFKQTKTDILINVSSTKLSQYCFKDSNIWFPDLTEINNTIVLSGFLYQLHESNEWYKIKLLHQPNFLIRFETKNALIMFKLKYF